jgi:hypothetical protein
MFRKAMLSAVAAAALTGVCVTAQAQVLVEIEGPMSAYTRATNNSGTLTVMNNKIAVTADTAFVSPTQTRDDLFRQRNPDGTFVLNQLSARYNVENWVRGDNFFARSAQGLLGATVIVTGTVDPLSGVITAEEVFSDIAENVVLGAIYENQCTNATCDAPGDFIRGNGPAGPVFIPNKDLRLPALPITDAGLFELNLAGKDLGVTEPVVTTFGGEGYFSEGPVKGAEQGIVYYAFAIGENRPDLLLNPGIPELSTLRVRCTEGDRIEVRGFVHAPTDANGNPTGGRFVIDPATNTVANFDNPTSGGQGRIRVTMRVNGVLQTFLDEDGEPPVADVPGVYGRYQLRQEVDQCGDTVNVYWDRANTTNLPWASALNVPVDRLREDAAEE